MQKIKAKLKELISKKVYNNKENIVYKNLKNL